MMKWEEERESGEWTAEQEIRPSVRTGEGRNWTGCWRFVSREIPRSALLRVNCRIVFAKIP